jgi:hypothetical protein
MDQVRNWIDRPCVYNNIDGLAELGMGFMFLGYGLFQWLNAHTAETALWHRTYVLIAYVAILSLILHFGTKAIKERITYPRTGFVAYRKQQRWLIAIVSFCVGALMPFALIAASRSHWHFAAVPLLFGVGMTAASVRLARSVPWKWTVAGAMLLATFVTSFLPAEVFAALVNDTKAAKHPALTELVGGTFLCMIVYGTIFLISGAISLWLYVRSTQPPAQVEP